MSLSHSSGRSAPEYELVWPGKAPAETVDGTPLVLTDAHDGPEAPAEGFRGRLLWGDNRAAMAALLPEFRGKVDLVYLDPPFDAGRAFRAPVLLNGSRKPSGERLAYRDQWGTGPDSYLQMLYERLPLVRDLLAPTGSLIVHVNWRVGHLVQVLLDEVFGPGEREAPGRPGFRNEIVGGYGGGGAVRNAYRRKHDNLFWYTRSERWTFNPQYRPYTEGTRQRGLTAVKGDRYRLHPEGAQLETWWTDAGVQKILSPTAAENLKYPTQKPEALLERIIRGHSNPEDLVADFFCGSGTTGAVAERLGRRWLLADESPAAIRTTQKRLVRLQSEGRATGGGFALYRAQEAAPAAIAPMRAGRIVRLRDVLPAQMDADHVDYWAVDCDHQPPVFRHCWHAVRDRSGALVSEAPLPESAGRCAVRMIDAWGEEATVLLETGKESR
jgi:DNA modification methylase